MIQALEDIQEMGGIMQDNDYPYIGFERTCMFKPNNTVMTNTGSITLPFRDEKALEKMVARYGPVAVVLFSSRKMNMYKSGVFHDDLCLSTAAVNHAVLVVGYGSDPGAGDFWILKNSWSKKWGEGGYLKMVRGLNMCNVASSAILAKF